MTSYPQNRTESLAREGLHHSLYTNPAYNRGLADYNYLFGMSLQRLFANQLVLDLGAGSKAGLATSLADTDVRVVSLSPNSAGKHLTMPYRSDTGHLTVSGLAQQLPFRDKSFDGIVASWSVPMYLPRVADHFEATFSEAQRVLKPEGIALFAPVDDGDVLRHTLRAIRNTIDEACTHVGQNPDDRVIAIARTPETFERPEVQELLANIDDPAWRIQQDHPLRVGYLYGLQATHAKDLPATEY